MTSPIYIFSSYLCQAKGKWLECEVSTCGSCLRLLLPSLLLTDGDFELLTPAGDCEIFDFISPT